MDRGAAALDVRRWRDVLSSLIVSTPFLGEPELNSDHQPTNPYTPPAAEPLEVTDRGRTGLLHKEAILRVLGISYLFSACFWAMQTGKMAIMSSHVGSEVWQLVALFFVFTAVCFFCGYRLAVLRPGFRILISLVTGTVLLLAILMGVLMPLLQGRGEDWVSILETSVEILISTCGLWVLLSRAGRLLLSPEYRPIAAAAPRLEVWRTPAMIAGVLAILASRLASYL